MFPMTVTTFVICATLPVEAPVLTAPTAGTELLAKAGKDPLPLAYGIEAEAEGTPETAWTIGAVPEAEANRVAFTLWVGKPETEELAL